MKQKVVTGVEQLYGEDQGYGVPVPKSTEEAYHHDKESDTLGETYKG
jgi:hypothetical protein